jgi:hypothetical protein
MQAQSMSGVFSMAAHSVLQYLPEVVRQEQTGCAHFSAFVSAINDPRLESPEGDPPGNLSRGRQWRLSNK